MQFEFISKCGSHAAVVQKQFYMIEHAVFVCKQHTTCMQNITTIDRIEVHSFVEWSCNTRAINAFGRIHMSLKHCALVHFVLRLIVYLVHVGHFGTTLQFRSRIT